MAMSTNAAYFLALKMVRSFGRGRSAFKREYIDDFMIHEPLGPIGKDPGCGSSRKASRLKEQGKFFDGVLPARRPQ